MKVELKLTPENFLIIGATLQPVYNSKAHTRREKSTVSIALDVVSRFDSKISSIKGKLSLFDAKKRVKITLKHHEGDMLELLLLDQIKFIEETYVRQQVQSTIDQLNQKLA